MTSTGSGYRPLRTAFGLFLPLGIGIGFMLGGVGTLMWPPMGTWTAPLVCSGTVAVQSDYYTTPSGGSGVQRHVGCVAGTGKDAAADDITGEAILLAILAYGLVAFVLLLLIAGPRMRRRAEARAAAFTSAFGPEVTATGVESPAELQAILGQVAAAMQQGGAQVSVRQVTIDGAGGSGGGASPGLDPAARLEALEALRDAGFLTEAEYAAKRAEILAGL